MIVIFCGFAQPLTHVEFYLRIYSGEKLAVENLSTRSKACSIATLSTTNSTWTDLGLNLGLCGLRLVTNHLRHVTANKVQWNLGS
jgi:hypothetical protein